MYEYRAKRKNKTAVLLTALFTLLFATGMLYMTLSEVYRYAVEFLTVLSAVLALAVAGRYLLVDYLYVVREDGTGVPEFLVVEQKGKRNKIVCRLSVSEITETVRETPEVREALKARFHAAKHHNYCVDIGYNGAVCLFLSEDEAETAIRISPDEHLLSLLRAFSSEFRKTEAAEHESSERNI